MDEISTSSPFLEYGIQAVELPAAAALVDRSTTSDVATASAGPCPPGEQ
jgi:hypothetical protein